MKINAIDIKPGNILEHSGKLWLVLKRELIQPGKGGSFAQVEMRDIRTGTKSNERYRTQETVERETIGEPAYFRREGMICTIQLYEGVPLAVELPQTVTMAVVEADPVVKGQTASSSYKPGKLENGRRVMLPPHIGAGTRIVVNTADGSYIERAKD